MNHCDSFIEITWRCFYCVHRNLDWWETCCLWLWVLPAQRHNKGGARTCATKYTIWLLREGWTCVCVSQKCAWCSLWTHPLSPASCCLYTAYQSYVAAGMQRRRGWWKAKKHEVVIKRRVWREDYHPLALNAAVWWLFCHRIQIHE